MKEIKKDGVDTLLRIDDDTTIFDILMKFISIESDIHQHLFTLYLLSKDCKHVTEMGSRWGHSTFSILASDVPEFIAYDLQANSNIEMAINLAKKEKKNFKFIEKNVLEIEIEPTDMLFIDTWHKYGQLIEELRLHSKNVNKYIVLHDTTSYEYEDEPDWNVYFDVKPLSNIKKGLWPAVNDFLEENKDWYILMRYTHNNGLTILKRR